jgi:hypothetical protein
MPALVTVPQEASCTDHVHALSVEPVTMQVKACVAPARSDAAFGLIVVATGGVRVTVTVATSFFVASAWLVATRWQVAGVDGAV